MVLIILRLQYPNNNSARIIKNIKCPIFLNGKIAVCLVKHKVMCQRIDVKRYRFSLASVGVSQMIELLVVIARIHTLSDFLIEQ